MDPIYLLDGKVIGGDELKKMDVDKIESINVYKGEKAVRLFGEKAANGVIVIKSKPLKINSLRP